MEKERLDFHPLTPERWEDFELLFGKRGACAGCWCMYWRMKRSEFDSLAGEGTKKLIKELVDGGGVPGILAYQNGEPVGWCSFGPRDDFPTLQRSRILKPLDDQPVWSVVCFFVKSRSRRKGVTVHLLHAVIDYVRQKGGKTIEGYPVEPKKDKISPAFAYTGLASAFTQAGFIERARRSETRPIMRYYL
jgi:GNAT superfamily N-acetyltransferase